MLQEWASGRREAVWTLYADETFWAWCAQVAHRMVPLLGGTSVVRETIAVPADTRRATESLIAAIGLEGVSETEFRRNVAGEPLLMEVNARLSASIELAVRAGVDFPYLLYQWAAGEPLAHHERYRVGVRMRWLGGDIFWLGDTLAHQSSPEATAASRAVALFVGDFFRRSGYDYVDVRDPAPALIAAKRFVRGIPAALRMARCRG